MALKKLQKSFAPTTKQIGYLAKSFDDWRQNLMEYTKTYFPDSYNDFSEASPGTIAIELASYVGDVLGFYTDYNFSENLMLYATEQPNMIAIAQSLGYSAKPATAAYTDLDIYQVVPSLGLAGNYEPDERFYLRLSPGATFGSSQFGSAQFRTIMATNFDDPTDREVTVYSVDGQNSPSYYLVKKTVRVVAGTIQTLTVNFVSPSKFAVVTIPDTSVLDVISVVDGNGNVWSQVDYLAQDLIFADNTISNPITGSNVSVAPTFNMTVTRTPRRFVVRYNAKFQCELHFGSGILNDTDSSINLEPNKLASSEYQTNLASTTLDPSDFLSSTSYGVAPVGQFTITYSTGGGIATNVPSNTIDKIVTVSPINDQSSFTPADLATWNIVKQSIGVNNLNPATGGKGPDSVEEIRQNALAYFNAQNRLVTAEDYIARTYAMPSKYGGVAKAFVTADSQINGVLRATLNQEPPDGLFVTDDPGRGIINLYILGYNQNKQLVPLNNDVKENLATYLDTYRMLTDSVQILDAFVITIGVNFKISVFQNYNMNEVLARTIDAVANFFDVDRWAIQQPIIISDLYTEIASCDGVQSVSSLEIVNKYSFVDGAGYSDFIYSIDSATFDGVILSSLDPSIFAIQFPDVDIRASATQ